MRDVAERIQEVIVITDGVTRIEINPNEIRQFIVNGFASTTPQARSPEYRYPTGARVTVEFARPTPIPTNCEIRVFYDIADNGDLREILGVPLFTHTTARQDRPGASYHYRMSHWIPAASIMQFILPQYAPGLAA